MILRASNRWRAGYVDLKAMIMARAVSSSIAWLLPGRCGLMPNIVDEGVVFDGLGTARHIRDLRRGHSRSLERRRAVRPTNICRRVPLLRNGRAREVPGLQTGLSLAAPDGAGPPGATCCGLRPAPGADPERGLHVPAGGL